MSPRKCSKLILVKCGNVQVRIYRRQRKKGGQVLFQHDVADYATGHRKFISFANEKQARAKAGEIAEKSAKGERDALTLTNQNRAANLRAMERLNPTQTPLEVAAAHFAEAHHRLGGRSIIEAVNFFVRRHPLETPRKTVSEIYEEML